MNLRGMLETLFYGNDVEAFAYQDQDAPVDIFLEFQCEVCGHDLVLHEKLEPGQAAVLSCDNCGESWTIVLPSIELHKTSDYEPIWEHTSQRAPVAEG